MIVCSCNVITKEEIEDVVFSFLDADAWQLITVGMVYHAMEKRGKCCGCFPNAILIIVEAVKAWHASHNTPRAEVHCFVDELQQRLIEQENHRTSLAKSMPSSHAA